MITVDVKAHPETWERYDTLSRWVLRPLYCGLLLDLGERYL